MLTEHTWELDSIISVKKTLLSFLSVFVNQWQQWAIRVKKKTDANEDVCSLFIMQLVCVCVCVCIFFFWGGGGVISV